jgi:pyrroloquinoline quinone (PQQ) biosynthesis protein C
MIGIDQLRVSTRNQLVSHPFVQSIASGEFCKEQYAAYLCDVFHYARHSSAVIGAAACRLIHAQPALSEYLFRHASEELGHDDWARSDLLVLGWVEERILGSAPSDACLKMMALEYFYAAHDNPVGLFGWMYTLECLGGDVAGPIAAAIDKCLDLGGNGIYFLKGHGDADAHHSVDLTNLISSKIDSEVDKQAPPHGSRESSMLFGNSRPRLFQYIRARQIECVNCITGVWALARSSDYGER